MKFGPVMFVSAQIRWIIVRQVKKMFKTTFNFLVILPLSVIAKVVLRTFW